MDIFIILLVVMFSQVLAYMQTHQIVNIKCVQNFVYHYILMKMQILK
jgi:hypothetical protein